LVPEERDKAASIALGVDVPTWRRFVDECGRSVAPDDAVGGRLAAMRAAWNRSHGGDSGPPRAAATRCPACGGVAESWLERRALLLGRCERCGHAVLLEGGAPPSLYEREAYYQRVDPGTHAGYAAYEAEQVYREAKGARLLDRIERAASTRATAMLEIGSGFGFTRCAAEARGIRTAGVDVNPHAGAAAKRLYGFGTHVGDLASALASGVVARGAYDLVVAQFVLEHVVDPAAELACVVLALAPGGHAALVVPSADAAEIEVFGPSYRSFRADHLHLFSRRSLDSFFRGAGLELVELATEDNLHLLLGGFSRDELERDVYGAGLGPDIVAVATKRRCDSRSS
jgi:SAM-dependent methyltransferase